MEMWILFLLVVLLISTWVQDNALKAIMDKLEKMHDLALDQAQRYECDH
jgi:outer membrane lipoprotein-sorting protein